MDLTKIGMVVMRVVGLIPAFVAAVDKIKDAKGSEKKKAVIDSIDDFLAMAEAGIGKDVFNDPAILQLRDAVIEAEVALLRARDAYKLGLVNRAQPAA